MSLIYPQCYPVCILKSNFASVKDKCYLKVGAVDAVVVAAGFAPKLKPPEGAAGVVLPPPNEKPPVEASVVLAAPKRPPEEGLLAPPPKLKPDILGTFPVKIRTENMPP